MIRLFVLDVDGTLTEGEILLDGRGGETKRFDIQDGMGLVLLRRAGIGTAFLSGRASDPTDQRARDLGVPRCANGAADKLPLLRRWADEDGLTPEEVAYMGDDLPDLECLSWSGFPIVPSNGRPEALRLARYGTPRPGGRGAVRDAADRVLLANAREREGIHHP